MNLRGRSRTAPRHRISSDDRRARPLAFAVVAAMIAIVAFALLSPRGSLTTPGPLSASHARAEVACRSCHDAPSTPSRAAASSPEAALSDRVRVGTEACRNCHGDHGLRSGHARASATGALTCATCHPAHGAEAVRFTGDGHALHSTPTGTTERVAAPLPSTVTVPVLRARACAGCHDPSRADDPLRACIDASGASSPPLLVRCFGEHDRGGAPSGKSACAAQHGDARFAARDAAVRVVAGTSRASLGATNALSPWLGLGPIALGLVAYGGSRFVRRRKTKVETAPTAPLAPPTVRKLPVIDASRCLGCYACVDACAFDVLSVERYVAKVARPDACCGAVSCEAACPNGSLVMRDEGSPAPGPRLSPSLESEVRPGVFFAGDVTGVPLIRNAVMHGRRAADAVLERKRARDKSRSQSGSPQHDADVLIIGAGPAGLAASLRAQELGLSYLTLEQHAVAASIKSFPRGKLVFDAPLELPLEGQIFVRECTKEELVAQWARIVRVRQPRVLERHRVVDIVVEDDGATFVVTYARADESQSVLRAGAVIVAIGQRGTPRRLTATIATGADAMVSDALFDARSFAGRRVVVVGLGDAAMEAAQALSHQPGTEVIVVHRGADFERGRARNIEEMKALALAGRISVRFATNVVHVAEGKVTLEHEGRQEEVEIDAVLALIGGTPGTALLESLGLAKPGA